MKYRIVNIQACDLYQVKNGEMVSSAISLKHVNKQGEVRNNRWMYTAMFNESMLNDKFEKLIERGDIVKKSEAIFPKPNKNTTTLYTNQIIQLKFEYAVKDETVEDKIARVKNKTKAPRTFMNREDLRKYVYEHGFDIDGVHYVYWMRGGSSARVGKSLFINEKLVHSMNLASNAGLDLRGKSIDLAAFEAYRSLMLSVKIDLLKIKPENILLIDDYESVFNEDCNVTSVYRKQLFTKTKEVEVHNSIWDGQSLIDPSIMGKYSDKGMLLLRHLMFKSCCFNCNIQQWFADNGITDISQLNGKTVAKDIKDIKFITTPSSIKYKKFGDKDNWFDEWLQKTYKLGDEFGIVKYEKPPKHEKHTMVRTHYQLINTLLLTDEELQDLVQPSVDKINAVVTDPEEMLSFCSDYINEETVSMQTKRELVYKLLNMNMEISNTEFYANLTKKIKEEMRGEIKQGKILVNGNYSTLCGNPIEMLQQSIGAFEGKSIIGEKNVVSTRFEDGIELLVCRSPHITMGNLYLPKNSVNELVLKYMNFTTEIIGINSINENTLQRLQGCDFDSDTALITDNSILIGATKKYYNKFKVPFNAVEAESNPKEYTMENLAELDHKTSVNLIGEIVNLSQVLNSLYWQRKNENAAASELREIYKDICTLSVMSGIEIDKAKKVFTIDSKAELDKIRTKYAGNQFPQFFEYIDKKKSTKREVKRSGYTKYQSSMEKLYAQIKNKKLEVCKADGDIIDLIMGYKDKRNINLEQAEMIIHACLARLAANEAISKETTKEDIFKAKIMKDEDLVSAFKIICKKKVGVNTIRYCVSEFHKLDKGNSLTEYMLLGLIECKEDVAIKALKN